MRRTGWKSKQQGEGAQPAQEESALAAKNTQAGAIFFRCAGRSSACAPEPVTSSAGRPGGV
jgi:hypothetical protein